MANADVEEHAQADLVRFLGDPAHHAGAAVARISTHGAHIFLAGARAYKMKRAVKYPFMDFSTAALRRAAIMKELALNRALAPDLYLGVRNLSRTGGRVSWGDDNPVEAVLVMRRFSEGDMLRAVLDRGGLSAAQAERLADLIAAFHRDAAVVRRDEPTHFARMAGENLATLTEALGAHKLAPLATESERALTALRDHLQARARGGFVRRGHGDLHLGNIVVHDGVVLPFDALEFDDALATGDVYYDLAYLLMDLEAARQATVANRILNRYVARSGDIAGLRGLPLFLATRALVRAKVLVLQNADGGEVGDYLSIAARSFRPSPPMLVAIGGLSGSGKSTVAETFAPVLAAAPGALVLRSDLWRKRLAGVEPNARLPSNAYSREASARVYAALMQAAAEGLAAGQRVILDAVFARSEERDRAAQTAADAGVPFYGFWLAAPLALRVARIGGRVGDASDADAQVARLQETFAVGRNDWRTIDATQSVQGTIAAITADCAASAPVGL